MEGMRAFADRVPKWADELAAVYTAVEKDGKHRHLPVLRSYLGGSAGSGKSTTLRTCVQHIRLMFMKQKTPAKVVLTAYTGVEAFNIGFGARTACSAFQIFPNAAWKSELQGEALRKLEDTWEDVVLLIIFHRPSSLRPHAFSHAARQASVLQQIRPGPDGVPVWRHIHDLGW